MFTSIPTEVYIDLVRVCELADVLAYGFAQLPWEPEEASELREVLDNLFGKL